MRCTAEQPSVSVEDPEWVTDAGQADGGRSVSDALRRLIRDIVRAVRAAEERQIGFLLNRFAADADADMPALFALRDALAEAADHRGRRHP
ncbi:MULTISPECIES: hypothetical protein [unclassified Streptomyces]|uniref:Uncharacterized protein n=1 Tax=Streptomyces sp. NBC_00060 TaxID=2975636 RepID=A0AAU2GZL5_9ACTN